MTEPREVRIDGCLDWAFETCEETVMLTLFRAHTVTVSGTQKRETVRLAMPAQAAAEIMSTLAMALPRETVLPLLQDAFTESLPPQ